jgi:cytochrome b
MSTVQWRIKLLQTNVFPEILMRRPHHDRQLDRQHAPPQNMAGYVIVAAVWLCFYAIVITGYFASNIPPAAIGYAKAH